MCELATAGPACHTGRRPSSPNRQSAGRLPRARSWRPPAGPPTRSAGRPARGQRRRSELVWCAMQCDFLWQKQCDSRSQFPCPNYAMQARPTHAPGAFVRPLIQSLTTTGAWFARMERIVSAPVCLCASGGRRRRRRAREGAFRPLARTHCRPGLREACARQCP